MTDIRIVTDSTLPPARVLRAAHDFSPATRRVFPAVRADTSTSTSSARLTADVDRRHPRRHRHQLGTMPLRLVPTRPGHCDGTGSNVYAHPGSSWQLTATPSKRGSRVEMVWQRTFRRNPRGLFFGTLFRIACRPIFGHYARQVIANLEALERNLSPHQMARRPRPPSRLLTSSQTGTALQIDQRHA